MSRSTSKYTADTSPDVWEELKAFSNARIALGHVGNSIPLKEVLQLKLAHAYAKDAIYTPLDVIGLQEDLKVFNYPIFHLKTKVKNRDEYLRRPDLGKELDAKSISILNENTKDFDIVFVITDGLSATAVNSQIKVLLETILDALDLKDTIAIALVEQGRVAIGDPIASLLKARFSVVCIGERPGLSSPKSMGIYTTYNPTIGTTDERRNCISNVHAEGLQTTVAAKMLHYLLTKSIENEISGVNLKLNMNQILNFSRNFIK